ncbi:3-hydroxyacyl-CoA dehydrogenase [Pseudooceanicola sp. GBMRC 2024]|uniref:3-hydroxyacyl-CoA dehydrogenase n=1 Tax=Pseudooceanicola albus TaxID=2692189 RepID=A0A6L7G234_9RHOB|nr:3-hydroxyacyl-CoA dehydrogenase NAD-binding domain-containing protein [Pseudooceanicola albus]MXN17949.1 3-hydroxyacyl-CoA dehydrogenase [Pseudooceanicola albus]
MKTIAVIGFGTIGQRWAAAFAHHGLSVRAYDPDPAAAARFEALKEGLYGDLDTLHGARTPTDVQIFSDLAEALKGADFVQENGPEALELKQALLAEIERHVAPEVLIASSSSALLVSDMQALCAHPERIVLAHPFNPAHIMPLVEIVGGRATASDVPGRARAFYESLSRKPVVLNREITGHLALRLMAAMWREAIALHRDGVASLEDIDRAFIYGPGPKWGVQGAFISNGLNAEGMAAFLAKYGPTYQAIWDDLGTARLDPETCARLNEAAAPLLHDPEALRGQRDAAILSVLGTVAERGPL